MAEVLPVKYYQANLDFWEDWRIRSLETLRDGATYVKIYQKILCLSLQTGGVIIKNSLFETFGDQIANSLVNEDVGNINQAIVKCSQLGLMEIVEKPPTISLLQLPVLIQSYKAAKNSDEEAVNKPRQPSMSPVAIRMRKYRQRKKERLLLAAAEKDQVQQDNNELKQCPVCHGIGIITSDNCTYCCPTCSGSGKVKEE